MTSSATSAELLLLKAATLNGAEALSAWQDWKAAVDFERLDSKMDALLPLLCRNLLAQGVDELDPLLSRLKGIYRRTWVQNQRYLPQFTTLLTSLHQENIPVVLLNHSALVCHYYPDLGVRSLQPLEISVDPNHMPRTIDSLLAQGYVSPHSNPISLLPYRPFIIFQHSSGLGLRLHPTLEIGATVPIGTASEAFIPDQPMPALRHSPGTQGWKPPAQILNPTHQLLWLCIQGTNHHVNSGITWLADAGLLLQSLPTRLDWQEWVHQVQRHQVISRTTDALLFLKTHLNGAVPSPVLAQLETLPRSDLERHELDAIMAPTESFGVQGMPIVAQVTQRLKGHYWHYLRSHHYNSKHRRRAFWGYLFLYYYKLGPRHLRRAMLAGLSAPVASHQPQINSTQKP